MMPGGDAEAYKFLQPIVEKVAAQTDDGPCVTYIGKGGSGARRCRPPLQPAASQGLPRRAHDRMCRLCPQPVPLTRALNRLASAHRPLSHPQATT